MVDIFILSICYYAKTNNSNKNFIFVAFTIAIWYYIRIENWIDIIETLFKLLL